jgi:hypothetical protein
MSKDVKQQARAMINCDLLTTYADTPIENIPNDGRRAKVAELRREADCKEAKMSQLPWCERLVAISIHPLMATPDDIARMAAELMTVTEACWTRRHDMGEKCDWCLGPIGNSIFRGECNEDVCEKCMQKEYPTYYCRDAT